MFCTAGQRNGSPRAQIRHLPHDPIGDAATGWPSRPPGHLRAERHDPPAELVPEDLPRRAGCPFCTACTSDPHSPQASTATMTSSGPGGVRHVADRGPGLKIHILNGPHWLPASQK